VNDVRALAPGVYFYRETADFASQAQPSTIAKIIVTR